ncbi:MAG: hypothetical protein HYR75_04480 [Gemmatimonadetes bacterium]|nr:hypothetical protein [Gemmatimonadota bacterium]MBI3569445.1 hypothetical protein [Gemmatimonadota bacterium]
MTEIPIIDPDGTAEPPVVFRPTGDAPADGTRFPSFRVLALKVLGVELLALLLLWWLQHSFAS